jgi:hypothetical protein
VFANSLIQHKTFYRYHSIKMSDVGIVSDI